MNSLELLLRQMQQDLQLKDDYIETMHYLAQSVDIADYLALNAGVDIDATDLLLIDSEAGLLDLLITRSARETDYDMPVDKPAVKAPRTVLVVSSTALQKTPDQPTVLSQALFKFDELPPFIGLAWSEGEHNITPDTEIVLRFTDTIETIEPTLARKGVVIIERVSDEFLNSLMQAQLKNADNEDTINNFVVTNIAHWRSELASWRDRLNAYLDTNQIQAKYPNNTAYFTRLESTRIPISLLAQIAKMV